MKLLSDREFKQIKETIEMYKEEYNQSLEDYYKLIKQYKNLNELLSKFQSKNQKLTNKLKEKNNILNKVTNYIEENIDGNKFESSDDVIILYNYIEDLIKIIKGVEK